MDQKNKKKDIFEAIRIIYNILPSKTYLKKNTNSLSSGYYLGKNFITKINLPEFNQSSMDGIGISKISKEYKIVGKTELTKLNKKILNKNECLVVKTGSLINNSIKKIIPIEDLFKEGDSFKQKTITKNMFIRKKGHIVKANSIIFKKGHKLSNKDIQFVENFNSYVMTIIKPLSFTLIGTGDEFFKNNGPKATNIKYLKSFLSNNNQVIEKSIMIKDDQKKLEELIKKSKSNIIIVTGGTGKSDDDFNFNNKKLILDGLDLKPGKPLKVMKVSGKVVLYFPGNPCSNFVLTNILLKGLLDKYYTNTEFFLDNLKKDLKFPFKKLKRKSFLFAKLEKNRIKIFKDQESSNILNIINSNILIYYNKTKNLKYINIYD